MVTLIIVLLALILLVLIYSIFAYNRLVRLQNLTQEGWSGIDVQLKQRANLIPNLVEAVKGYMGHERGVLEKVTELRVQALASTNLTERATNENQLTSALKQLFAVSENYPDLKASQNFIELQQALASIENQIQLARRYYNGTARDLNIAIQSFPSNVIANNFHFKPVAFFEIADSKERDVPAVKLS
jgi:LemA protein